MKARDTTVIDPIQIIAGIVLFLMIVSVIPLTTMGLALVLALHFFELKLSWSNS